MRFVSSRSADDVAGERGEDANSGDSDDEMSDQFRRYRPRSSLVVGRQNARISNNNFSQRSQSEDWLGSDTLRTYRLAQAPFTPLHNAEADADFDNQSTTR